MEQWTIPLLIGYCKEWYYLVIGDSEVTHMGNLSTRFDEAGAHKPWSREAKVSTRHSSMAEAWEAGEDFGCALQHYLKHQESKMGVSKNGVYRDRLQNYNLRKEPLSTGFGNNDIMI